MRFIIRELPYEKPLAAGQWRYELNGRDTGAVEKWRLNSAASGYRFLRVDLDARDAKSGHSYLYHMVLNEHGRPERLSYRFWGSGLQISGNVLLEVEALTATRDVNGTRYEDLVMFQIDCGFWFPSSVGLGLLASCAHNSDPPAHGRLSAVTLNAAMTNPNLKEEQIFALQQHEVHVSLEREESLEIMGQDVLVRPFNIRWGDQERTIWLDETNWPLKMVRGDGMVAVETRYIHYS